MALNQLLNEELAVVASFNAAAVADTLKATNEAIDMSLFEKASFIVITDDTYIDTDADLTIQLFEVATQTNTGGVALTGKAATLVAVAGAAVHYAQVDIRNDELTEGKSFVYAEVIAAGATQTAVVSVIGQAGGIKNGLGKDNSLANGTRVPN